MLFCIQRIKNAYLIKKLALFSLLIVLSACSGDTPPNNRTLPSISLGGRIIDPPISNASVFFDQNCNDILDADELSTTSDSDGFFAITFSSRSMVSNCGLKIVALGGTDTVTGEDLPISHLVNSLVTDINQDFIITPLSTISSELNATEIDSLLSTLGISSSVQIVFSSDPWDMESADASNNLLNVNLQIANIISAFQSISGVDERIGNANLQRNFASALSAMIADNSASYAILRDATQLNKLLVDTLSEGGLTLDPTAGALVNNFLEATVNTNAVFNNGNINFANSMSAQIIGNLQAVNRRNIGLVLSRELSINEFTDQTSQARLLANLSDQINSDSNDFDDDGVIDTLDAFPLDENESIDTDGDGIGNNTDTDDDGDGVADISDALPLDAKEIADTDGDGIGNNADTDDDGDGVADSSDAFPLDANEIVDTDGDGIGNNADTDDDGDRVADNLDSFPLDPTQTIIDSEVCASLTQLIITNVSITSAALATNNPSSGDPLPEYCRVIMTIGSSNVEIFLPKSTSWNGRYVGVGSGSTAGYINYSEMDVWLADSYVTASTDTGHVSGDPTEAWMLIEGRWLDYAYLAIHDMTEVTKQIILEYYKRPQDYSYFHSTSNGGRAGLMESQRYPDDYDGIVAINPALNFQKFFAAWLYAYTINKPPSRSPYLAFTDGVTLPALSAIHTAVLDQCDALDGVIDGVLQNPSDCTPDLSALVTATTITQDLADVVQGIWAGVKNSSGEFIAPIYEVGSEYSAESRFNWFSFIYWPSLVDGIASDILAFYRNRIFNDQSWDWRTADFDTILDDSAEGFSAVQATDPDLSDFADNGSKIIMAIGWSDGLFPPRLGIEYYETVIDHLEAQGISAAEAREQAENTIRLFMMPGTGHSLTRAAAGVNNVDFQAAIENWVENGIAPDSIDASKVISGTLVFERILCPYPQEAVYDGSGDTTLRSSYSCQE